MTRSIASDSARPRDGDEPPAKLHILFVDDDAGTRFVMAQLFALEGHQLDAIDVDELLLALGI